LLWSGGRTAADKLLVAFRNHTPGGPPYVGYFGSLTWAAAPAARVAPRIVTSAVSPLYEVTYLMQLVSPSSNPQGAQAALDRALALLPGLTVPAYHVACSRPRERLPFVVIDGPIRWETRAALWEVWAEAAGGAP
jgi:hypothetical protein